MKIIIKDIPARGLDLREDLDPEAMGLKDKDIRCVTPLHVEAKVEKIQDTVIAKAHVEADFQFECARCLESVEQHKSEDFMFDYPIENLTDAIDLGEDIRQEVILILPVTVLCKEACKGLCPGCGANLNLEACKCKK